MNPIDLSSSKIALSLHDNATPIAATDTTACNGTYVITKHNALVDALQSASNVVPPLDTSVQAHFDDLDYFTNRLSNEIDTISTALKIHTTALTGLRADVVAMSHLFSPPSPPTSVVTWDAWKSGSSFTLSNNLLTATPTTSNMEVVLANQLIKGKRCWEVSSTDNKFIVGVANSSVNVYSQLGSDDNAWGLLVDQNEVVHYNSPIGNNVINTIQLAKPLTIMVAYDADNGFLSFYANGQLIQSIANIIGNLYPAGGSEFPSVAFTANFGQTPFSNSIPIGFTAIGIAA